MIVSSFVVTAATAAKVVALAKKTMRAASPVLIPAGPVIITPQPLADCIKRRRSKSSR